MAILYIFESGGFVGEFNVRVPTTSGLLCVPQNVMDLIEAEGDAYEFMIQVRTNDDNNRYYTDSEPVDGLRRENRGVVVVPLN